MKSLPAPFRDDRGFLFYNIMEANTSRRKQILRLLLERDNFVCGICNSEITDVSKCNIDHILPKSKGGSNQSTNLQPAHIKCNTLKSDSVPSPLVFKPKRKNIDQAVTLEENELQIIKVAQKERDRDANFQFVSDAIARKQRADAFLDGVLAKQKETPRSPNKRRRPVVLKEKVLNDAPVRLWNEIVKNGFKNLSYDEYLSYFEEYRKAQVTLQ